MSLYDQIGKDIVTAMKAQDKVRLEPLRFLKSLLIQNKTAAKPIEEMDVLISHTKKLKDSIALFPEGSELATKTLSEIKVLEDYMPKALSESEVQGIIDTIKAKLPTPHAPSQMGLLMKELSPQIKGRFDGKRANDLVKLALES